ncbi:Putative neutral zinc metallopeptidase [Corynebacterium kalinowskii]|uniref:Neutral zinc metallopeptidase n=1 Tax=Corynebacterium kalinowskii TaxID=2675216 RepID=A0A6B8VL06_9CORY|nr:neutral zinc metallopeptidase [Corynebacterium kalinowskii]QGU02124.1 Putative neutral zinc metallopeptidase [Corynebacterium kalinowskii]
MTFREDFQKTENRASRGGGGGRLAAGGGIGTLLMVGLFLLMGGNPADIGQVIGQQQQVPAGQEQSGGLDECKTGADANNNVNCRIEFTGISVDRVWEKLLPEQAGIQYTEPGLVVFENTTNSGCGTASANTGPFYCPGDQSTYFDGSFFAMLEKLGGENAPLAQEYIVAHEFGHHIQKLEGTLGLSNYNDPGAESNAVKIELQADCYAGIWAHHADDGEDAILNQITPEQVESAMKTAAAVGDDNIQKRSGGSVRPDLWTHGSSKDRANAFLTGFNEGTMKSCDTLGRGVYK